MLSPSAKCQAPSAKSQESALNPASALPPHPRQETRVRILVLGGDGYLGWPTALHLSAAGHQVGVADNFVRRQYDVELGVESLVPIRTLEERVACWAETSGWLLDQYVGDLCDPAFVHAMVREFDPDTIVHFAEQSSAPYSM